MENHCLHKNIEAWGGSQGNFQVSYTLTLLSLSNKLINIMYFIGNNVFKITNMLLSFAFLSIECRHKSAKIFI